MRTGRTDPERILPLLWRHHRPAEQEKPKGRPPRLSVDAVVNAAIERADADGLEAASMGRLFFFIVSGTM